MDTMEFQKMVSDHCKTPEDGDAIRVIDELEAAIEKTTRKAKDIGLSGDDIKNVRTRLIDEAETRWMRTRYATLDMTYFQTKRREIFYGWNDAEPAKVEFKDGPSDDHEQGELPVFVCLWDSLRDFQRSYRNPDHGITDYYEVIGTISRKLVGRRKVGNEHTVSATVSMPSGINRGMFDRTRRAVAYLRLFDVLLLDRGLSRPQEHRDSSIDMGVLWCPTEESWTIRSTPPRPKGDPAILVRRNDNVYLIEYFDTPDEKPIDNLIREFSQGKVSKTLSKQKKK